MQMLHVRHGEGLQTWRQGMPGGVQPILKYIVGVGAPVPSNAQPSLQGSNNVVLRADHVALGHMDGVAFSQTNSYVLSTFV